MVSSRKGMRVSTNEEKAKGITGVVMVDLKVGSRWRFYKGAKKIHSSSRTSGMNELIINDPRTIFLRREFWHWVISLEGEHIRLCTTRQETYGVFQTIMQKYDVDPPWLRSSSAGMSGDGSGALPDESTCSKGLEDIDLRLTEKAIEKSSMITKDIQGQVVVE